MSTRQRNSASSKAWLAKMEAEGQQRATRKAQERVAGAVHLQMQQGITPFEAAANAIAAETGRPLEEAKAWLRQQVERQRVIKALAEPAPVKKPSRWEAFIAFLSGWLR